MRLNSYEANEVSKTLKALDATSGCHSGAVSLPDWGFSFDVQWDSGRDAHVASAFTEHSD